MMDHHKELVRSNANKRPLGGSLNEMTFFTEARWVIRGMVPFYFTSLVVMVILQMGYGWFENFGALLMLMALGAVVAAAFRRYAPLVNSSIEAESELPVVHVECARETAVVGVGR